MLFVCGILLKTIYKRLSNKINSRAMRIYFTYFIVCRIEDGFNWSCLNHSKQKQNHQIIWLISKKITNSGLLNCNCEKLEIENSYISHHICSLSSSLQFLWLFPIVRINLKVTHITFIYIKIPYSNINNNIVLIFYHTERSCRFRLGFLSAIAYMNTFIIFMDETYSENVKSTCHRSTHTHTHKHTLAHTHTARCSHRYSFADHDNGSGS